MQFFYKVDSAIIDYLFQPIANWVDARTGRTCFWLAKICAWIVVTTWAAQLIVTQEYLTVRGLFYAVWSIGALLQIRNWEKLDANRQELMSKRAMNPERISTFGRTIRLVTLLLLPPTVIGLYLFFFKNKLEDGLSVVQIWAFFCSLYFGACTPMPPAPLKVRHPLAPQAVPIR